MRWSILLILIVAFVLMGCSGNQSGEKTPTPTPTKTQTPAPTPTPSPKPTGTLELHGVGTCDQCHDPPTVKAMAGGIHKNAFEKQPDIHKTLCSNCHNVDKFCKQCHEFPQIMKN